MYHKNLLKLFCLLVTFFCSQNNVSAQTYPEFAPVDAQWTYVVGSPFWYPTIEKMQCYGTAVVKGKDCKIIGNFYAYRDSLKLYILRPGRDSSWKLAWDYGWQVNQVATIPMKINAPVVDSMSIKIIYRGDTTINGFTLPVQYYKLTDRDTISVGINVMNIGMLLDYYLPLYSAQYVDGWSYNLRCYEDTVIGSVKAPGTVVCDTNYVGVAEVSIPEFNIYPNPATDFISIENNSTNGTLQMINVLGQTVLTSLVQKGYSKIPLSGLMPGIYSYQLMANGTIVEKGRLSIHP